MAYDKYQKLKLQYTYGPGDAWVDVKPPRYKAGELIEKNSPDCGGVNRLYRWYALPDEFICDGYNKYYKEVYQISTDEGFTWENVKPLQTRTGQLIEENSIDCGYGITWELVEDEYICEETEMEEKWVTMIGEYTCEGETMYSVEKLQYCTSDGRCFDSDPLETRKGEAMVVECEENKCIENVDEYKWEDDELNLISGEIIYKTQKEYTKKTCDEEWTPTGNVRKIATGINIVELDIYSVEHTIRPDIHIDDCYINEEGEFMAMDSKAHTYNNTYYGDFKFYKYNSSTNDFDLYKSASWEEQYGPGKSENIDDKPGNFYFNSEDKAIRCHRLNGMNYGLYILDMLDGVFNYTNRKDVDDVLVGYGYKDVYHVLSYKPSGNPGEIMEIEVYLFDFNAKTYEMTNKRRIEYGISGCVDTSLSTCFPRIDQTKDKIIYLDVEGYRYVLDKNDFSLIEKTNTYQAQAEDPEIDTSGMVLTFTNGLYQNYNYITDDLNVFNPSEYEKNVVVKHNTIYEKSVVVKHNGTLYMFEKTYFVGYFNGKLFFNELDGVHIIDLDGINLNKNN